MNRNESLFSTLVRYSPERLKSQVENFTTELLAHCLRTIPPFLVGFLDLLKGRAGKTDSKIWDAPPERWIVKTQFPISTSNGLKKYPDLAMWHSGDQSFFLLVEVKVEAPTTLSLADDGQYVPQFKIYRKWLDDRSRWGRLFVLSKYHPDGIEYCDGHITWRDVTSILERLLTPGSKLSEAHRFLANEFAAYLKEQRMVPQRISIESIRTVREFLDVKSDLLSLLSQVAGRWREHFKLSSVPKGRSNEGIWKGDYYIYSASLRRGKHIIQPGLWLDADVISPFFWVTGLGNKAAAVLGKLRRVLGEDCAESWNPSILMVSGRCPQDLLGLSVEKQEDALFRSGVDTLKAIFKAIDSSA